MTNENQRGRRFSAWTVWISGPSEQISRKRRRAAKKKLIAVEPPDGGWGWFVTLGYFLCNFLIVCARMNYSIIFPELLKEFGEGAGSTSWISSIETALSFISGPLVAVLSKKYSNRSVTVGGSILAFIGLSSSIFATNIIYLTITYGVLTGIANCATRIPALGMLGRYFRLKHPIAQGIGITGIGLATFLMPPFAQFLKVTYGWRGALFIVSGLSLHTLVAACLLRPIYLKSDEELNRLHANRRASKQLKEVHRVNQSDGILTEGDTTDELVAPTTRRRSSIKAVTDYVKSTAYYSFDIHLFKNKLFLLTIVSFLFYGIGRNVLVVFVYAHAINIGIDDSRASFLLSAEGIAFIISALLQGVVLHRFFVKVNRVYVFLASWMFQGIFLVGLGFPKTYISMLICTSMEGFARGIWGSLNVVVIKQVVGEKYFTTGLGMSVPFIGIGQLLGPPISGYIYDATGSYKLSFCVAGCSIILGLLIVAPGHIFLRASGHSDNISENQISSNLDVKRRESVVRFTDSKETNDLNGQNYNITVNIQNNN